MKTEELDIELGHTIKNLRRQGWSDEGIGAYVAAKIDNDYEHAFVIRLREIVCNKGIDQRYHDYWIGKLKADWPDLHAFIEEVT